MRVGESVGVGEGVGVSVGVLSIWMRVCVNESVCACGCA